MLKSGGLPGGCNKRTWFASLTTNGMMECWSNGILGFGIVGYWDIGIFLHLY